MRTFLFLLLLLITTWLSHSQNLLIYAGSSGLEHSNDVVQLSDGTVLVAGGGDDLVLKGENLRQRAVVIQATG